MVGISTIGNILESAELNQYIHHKV